ncbi:hypothetical protein D3C76_1845660 [compost metagenome]
MHTQRIARNLLYLSPKNLRGKNIAGGACGILVGPKGDRFIAGSGKRDFCFFGQWDQFEGFGE